MHDDIIINTILIILSKLNGINVASMTINTVGDNMIYTYYNVYLCS